VESKSLIQGLKSLSDPCRVNIISFLAGCGDGTEVRIRDDGLTMCETNDEIACYVAGTSPGTVQVLKMLSDLRDAGLITMREEGRTAICSFNRSAFMKLVKEITNLATPVNHCRSCALMGQGRCPVH
jgi:DNA-binding transcriptional ArsR family regulator